MSIVLLNDFGTCTLYTDRDEKLVKTVFRDGSVVLAKPEDTQEYVRQANEAGYGSDHWSYCVHRDLFRTFMARSYGLAYSHVLHQLAHGLSPDLHEGAEEDAHLSRFLKRLSEATGR